MKSNLQLLFLITFLFFHTTAFSDEYVALESRQNIQQKFALINADSKAAASVILIPGGKGKIKIKDDDGEADIRKGTNFLVRSRHYFSEQGLNVAVIDAPSDKYGSNGMFYGFRNSDEHMTDLKAVIDYLKQKYHLPVWVIGTSRGTESVATAAIKLSNHLQGIVLTSSITEDSGKGTSLLDMKLDAITVPTLIVAHSDDACWVTPPDRSNTLKAAISNAKIIEVKMFSGGDAPISKPCKAKSQHGFLGIEKDVVKYISHFIKQNSLNKAN